MPTWSNMSCFVLSQLLPHYINLGHPPSPAEWKVSVFKLSCFSIQCQVGYHTLPFVCVGIRLAGWGKLDLNADNTHTPFSLHTIPPQREKWMLVFDMIHCLPFSFKTWCHKYWSWHCYPRFTQWVWEVYSLLELQVSLIYKEDALEF